MAGLAEGVADDLARSAGAELVLEVLPGCGFLACKEAEPGEERAKDFCVCVFDFACKVCKGEVGRRKALGSSFSVFETVGGVGTTCVC